MILIVRAILVSLAVITVFTPTVTIACTAFMISDGDKVLVGNNEDYTIPFTRVWFIPPENGQFGRVYFGYENWSPQGGVNDQGLFFEFFATKPLEVQQSKDKPKFKGPIIDTMVATCATVEDVIEMFSLYNLEFMSKFQMFVVDKTGDAAVIEGDEIVRKSGQYQIVTNFYQSKVPENKRPCEWYRRSCQKYKIAESMIKEIDTPTVAQFSRYFRCNPP
jgi:penicillin V acylase-like amidase (Ntn superfamily)